jgi:N-acetylglutamate synthase-like GNAT family acetyltransferase
MIAYRLATQADAPAVLALLEEIMEHHAVVPPARERLATVVSRIIAAKDHCFLLAETDEAPGGSKPAAVGMCALVFTMSTWSAAPVCELQDVIVTEEYRRSAVGQGLVAEAERIARARGCARLFLLAEYWNLGAHAFYRGLGLQEQTCLDFERDLSGGAAH